MNAIDDVDTLRRLLIDKERERQSIANDLDVAARLGLVISETNEAIQIKVYFSPTRITASMFSLNAKVAARSLGTRKRSAAARLGTISIFI